MDIRSLESFIVVAENGSFAEAARRLSLTPAAIAQRIRMLECEIGLRLVSRSGKTVKPTAVGAAILSRVKNVVSEVRDLKSVATADLPSGKLRLGAISTAVSGLLPNILKRVIKKYPQIELYIVPGPSIELYQRVVANDLDAAVIVQPPFAIPKGFGWRVWREEPLVVLLPKSLSAGNPHLALAKEPFIRVDRNNWGGQLVDGYLRRMGIRPQERFELDNFDAIAVLVSRGLGVSVVPDWAPPWPAGLHLRKFAVRDRAFDRRIGLIWPATSVRARLIETLLKEAAVTLPPVRAKID